MNNYLTATEKNENALVRGIQSLFFKKRSDFIYKKIELCSIYLKKSNEFYV